MITQYLLIAWRNLTKNQLHSFINILGLAIGLAACLTILAYVKYEWSFDKHHPDGERIYRIALNRVYPNREVDWAVIPLPVAPTASEQLPEIEDYTRLSYSDMLVARAGEKLQEDRVASIDSGFFRLFPTPVLRGAIRENFFERKDGILLTEKAAKRYFKDEDPVGKSFEVIIENEKRVFTVEALLKDPPQNSHFTYEIVTCIETLNLPPQFSEAWGYWGFLAYVKVQPNTELNTLTNKINVIAEQNMAKGDDSFQEWLNGGNAYNYFLQPVPDIHLTSNIMADNEANPDEPNSSKTFVNFFALIAVVILVIAVVNFVNLATARASHRMMEVGIRKTVGAYRQELILQFLIESTLLSAIALAVALPMAQLGIPYFNMITGKGLSLSFVFTPIGIGALALVPIVLGILSGSYPAFYLSHFRPTAVFQKKQTQNRKHTLRHALVVGQFVIAVLLIAGTATVYRQMDYIINKPLGFDKEQVISLDQIPLPEEQIEVFAEEARNLPGVESVSISSYPVDKVHEGSTIRHPDQPQGWVNATLLRTDEHYLNTMGMHLLAGRWFTEADEQQDPEAPIKVVLNATAANSLGWYPAEAVSQLIPDSDGTMKEIIGVVENFNFESLHKPVAPFQIVYGNFARPERVADIRTAPRRGPEVIAGLGKLYNKYAPDKLFQYEYMDEVMVQFYEAEQLTGQLFILFSSLAIFICCLGLFGLMAFMAERRAKEIGVRKVMGARVAQIILLLSKDFLRLVLISTIIALPLAWYALDQWLENFAFRVDNSVWVLLGAGVVATLISWITVMYYSYKSATVNPVSSLRQE